MRHRRLDARYPAAPATRRRCRWLKVWSEWLWWKRCDTTGEPELLVQACALGPCAPATRRGLRACGCAVVVERSDTTCPPAWPKIEATPISPQFPPRAKSLMKLKDTIRAKTKRTSGKCLRAIIQSLNPTLRGWFGYFKHSYKTTFSALDGWIRMRLRSILRKRSGRRGRGRGSDHHRWWNAFFAAQGLYSLKAAHETGLSILFEVKQTTDWRAVCGRSACTVRRGEGPTSIGPSYPYRKLMNLRLCVLRAFAATFSRQPLVRSRPPRTIRPRSSRARSRIRS